jgi:hypothetical protein
MEALQQRAAQEQRETGSLSNQTKFDLAMHLCKSAKVENVRTGLRYLRELMAVEGALREYLYFAAQGRSPAFLGLASCGRL